MTGLFRIPLASDITPIKTPALSPEESHALFKRALVVIPSCYLANNADAVSWLQSRGIEFSKLPPSVSYDALLDEARAQRENANG